MGHKGKNYERVFTIGSADTGASRLAVEVADTGSGIAKEDLQCIFEPFEQGPRSASRRHGGLGLGLAIARTLLEMQGGSLTAANRDEGCGSIFRVELDTISKLPDQDPPTDPALRADEDSLRILLVEDNPDTLRAISLLLRSAGFVVQTAVNVSEAIASLSIRYHSEVLSVPLSRIWDGSSRRGNRFGDTSARDSAALRSPTPG
jgi:hypothetical protein